MGLVSTVVQSNSNLEEPGPGTTFIFPFLLSVIAERTPPDDPFNTFRTLSCGGMPDAFVAEVFVLSFLPAIFPSLQKDSRQLQPHKLRVIWNQPCKGRGETWIGSYKSFGLSTIQFKY